MVRPEEKRPLEVRLPPAREGRTLPFTKDGKVAYLGTTLLDPEQYPAAELVALYRERWEIELAFDEIKNHLDPGGPIRSRTPEGVRQELWAYLAVHHAIRQFAHAAALAPGCGRRPRVLPEVRPHHPSQHSFPARSQNRQAHSLPDRGRAGGTQPPASAPARPGLPTRDTRSPAGGPCSGSAPAGTRWSPAAGSSTRPRSGSAAEGPGGPRPRQHMPCHLLGRHRLNGEAPEGCSGGNPLPGP
ncbi:transposase [Streptomyces virginiae]|uniref:transposase n=1 Tax=Streptomyces virginiae TaxID=1961 RepID=UPI0036EA0A01